MDAPEVRELQNSLRAMFAGIGEDPAALSAELRDLGWDEVVADHPVAAALLFEEHGRAGATSNLVDEAVLAALGVESAATVVAFPLSPADPLWEPSLAVRESAVVLDAVLRTTGGRPERILLPVSGAGPLLVPAAELTIEPVTGLDEDGDWARVTGTCPADSNWSVPTAKPWRDAVKVARRLLAAELVGLGRAALELAISHVTERRQFGQPIGTFQAVRFRMAETKVAVEAAAEAVRVAFAEDSQLSAAVAKALSGAAAESAVRNAAQVCGAMGLTWEFGLHPIIRRSFALDRLLGDTATLTEAFGSYVAQSPDAPQIDPLLVPLDY